MGARKKVLLVDDSRIILALERMILGDERFELLTAASGEEAIRVAAAARPDLVLMDVIMPGLDGYEACRRMRADPRMRDIPVLMVTTRGELDDVEAGYKSGCTDYIVKPIDAAELLAKVEDYLELTGPSEGQRTAGPPA